MVLFEVFAQDLAQITFAMAVAEQYDTIRFQHGFAQLVEVFKVHRRPLSGDVAVVAMTEPLMAAPKAMGLKGCALQRIAHQPPQPCSSVIKVNYQTFGLIAPHAWGVGFWMLGCDACLLQKPPQPQHSVCVDIGMVQARGGVQHHRMAIAEVQLQSMI